MAESVDFEKFIKDELVKYIHQELMKGHSPVAIKETLLRGGHDPDMVQKVINILHESNYDLRTALEKPVEGSLLNQEIYYDVLNAVIKYVELMLERGHNIHEIEHILYSHGHDKEIIDKAIEAVLFGQKQELKSLKDVPVFYKMADKFILPIELGIFLLFVLMISDYANVGIDRAVIGFLGLLVTILIVGVGYNKIRPHARFTLIIVPFLAGVGFFFLGTAFESFGGMDVTKLSVLNTVFGVVMTSFFLIVPVEEKRPHKAHYEEEPKNLLGEEIKSNTDDVKDEIRSEINRIEEIESDNRNKYAESLPESRQVIDRPPEFVEEPVKSEFVKSEFHETEPVSESKPEESGLSDLIEEKKPEPNRPDNLF